MKPESELITTSQAAELVRQAGKKCSASDIARLAATQVLKHAVKQPNGMWLVSRSEVENMFKGGAVPKYNIWHIASILAPFLVATALALPSFVRDFVEFTESKSNEGIKLEIDFISENATLEEMLGENYEDTAVVYVARKQGEVLKVSPKQDFNAIVQIENIPFASCNFPEFEVRFFNQTGIPNHVRKMFAIVEYSKMDLRPIPVVTGPENGLLKIENMGWGLISSGEIKIKSNELVNSSGETYRPIRPFAEVALGITEDNQLLAVSLAELLNLGSENVGNMDNVDVHLDDPSEIARSLLVSAFGEKSEQILNEGPYMTIEIDGQIGYDADQFRKLIQVDFEAAIDVTESGIGGWQMPELAPADIMLREDESNYQLEKLVSLPLNPMEVSRLTIRFGAFKSSHHRLKMVFELSDGTQLLTPTIDLNIHMSRNLRSTYLEDDQ